jgi:cephalosporin-C deacetylase-like acetyl esterase
MRSRRIAKRCGPRLTGAVIFAVWLLAAWLLVASRPAIAAPPTWEELRALYDYDANAPLDVRQEGTTEAVGSALERVSFASPRGGRVPAIVGVPRQGNKPYPALILLHGYGGRKDDWGPLIVALSAKGWAAIAIDAMYHGQRAEPGQNILSNDWASNRAAFIQTIIDERRALDYLASRGDIDVKRVGLLGASMGAIMGSITTAVEPRIKCAVLAVGGGDWRQLVEKSQLGAVSVLREQLLAHWDEMADQMAGIEPLNFAPHIAPRPVLMLNGKQDNIVVPACSQELYDALGEPKEIQWFDSGHGLPIGEALAKASAWLDAHL